ncbi:MAG: RIP metalloprotease RseP [Acetobacteraceae bacterium]|nr:RIP metalloprotease RseP [Acetobacteraceae bacterium]
MPETLRTPLAFIIVISILVFIHELGHYVAARWAGVHAEVFSIGFGKALWQRTDKRGTVWKIGWLPLGGYVKMHGQERPEDVPEAERANWRIEHTFHHKSLGRRAVVVAAGPIANFLLAIVLFAGLFLVSGRPSVEPVVGGLAAGGPAERAGMMVGDRILAIDGISVDSFGDIKRRISPRAGQETDILLSREGREQMIKANLGVQGDGPKAVGLLGISGSKTVFVSLSPWEALIGGVAQSWQVGDETLGALWQMISGQRGAADLGGPLRIAQLSGEMAQHGPANLISFIAVISVNLGLINLFPIPVLDGGHLLFFLAEAIRGRPLPPLAVEYCFRAGLAVLAGLFVFATWNDVTHLGWFTWLAKMLG